MDLLFSLFLSLCYSVVFLELLEKLDAFLQFSVQLLLLFRFLLHFFIVGADHTIDLPLELPDLILPLGLLLSVLFTFLIELILTGG